MIAETLFGMSEACWILTIAGILLLALAVIGTIKLVSCETARHGLAKVLTFTVVCMWMCYIAADKPARSGGDPHSPAAVLCEADSQDSQSPGEEPTRSGASTRLPDACDVGESEGFGAMPIATNLMAAAVSRGSNETSVVVAWPFGRRPVDDLVYVYAGTNLLELAKVFTLDVSQCVSNAFVAIADECVSGTNGNAQAFVSVGDATDTDGDGLSDSDERFAYKTDPASSDTDGDGLPDGEEIAMGSSPIAADTDGDGLGDGEELGRTTVVVGPLWIDTAYGDFDDIAYALSTSHCGCARWELPMPLTMQGTTVSNVTVSSKGAVFFNRAGYDNPGMDVGALDFSSPIEPQAVVAAPMSDDGLFFRTNAPVSSVKVGMVAFAGSQAVCISYENMGREGDGAETNTVSFQVVVRTHRPDELLMLYRYNVGDAVDGRNAGIGVQSMLGRRLYRIAYKVPGFVEGGKTVIVRLGTDTDPASSDTDGDGLTDGAEMSIGTSPHYIDTDRDGLPDDWEHSNGLDPRSADGTNGATGDFDEDGLSNLGEYLNGTDPSDTDGDTDNDGVSDAAEVDQESDPNDGADGGLPPEALQFRELEFNIYGDYAAWEMKIEGLGPDDMRVRKISMGAPSAANATTIKMRKGNAYRLTMRWLNCDGHNDKYAPWYCWQAKIDGLPQTQSYQDYSATRRSGNEVVVGNGWIAENAAGLLTEHVHESTYDYYGNPRPGNVAGGLSATLYVLGDPVLVFDYDRDGAITDAEAAIARDGTKTFRFWVNDDSDSGNINGPDDDIPGAGTDYADNHVNGKGDILDFTPVWIDTTTVFPPTTPLAIREAVTWKVRSDCANVMWTDISRTQAGLFHRTSLGFHFGTYAVLEMVNATVTNASDGAAMPAQILSAIRGSQDCGVFLIEGCAAGDNLVVEGWTAGNEGRKIVSGEANISVSSVEDMYRHLNMRGLSGETVTWNPSVGDPMNRPDLETSDKHLVFLHGANVTQSRARGWSAEVFKRMWQSGMTAKFTGVTWRSDIGSDANYHENVSNAFFTASVLAPQVSALPGTKVLMAHSLGNMVCSSMIQDYELNVDCYLMCNSAVPAEAYDTDEALRVPQLVHPEWTEYPTNSWASTWHWLFRNDSNDDRKFLGWPGRFANVSQYAVNFYSTGDEILELAANNNVHTWTGVGSSWGHYSWHKQELFKGRGGLGGTSWSGWNIEEKFPGIRKISVSQAQGMEPEDFKTNTVFYCYPSSMNQPTIPLLVRGAHLAQGIPALTPAAGRVAFGGEPMEQKSCNCHVQIERPNGWPTRSDYQGQWCHSDLKDVAYFYAFKFYEKAIEKGNLK